MHAPNFLSANKLYMSSAKIIIINIPSAGDKKVNATEEKIAEHI